MQDAKTFFEQGLERHVARDWRAAEAAYRRALELAPGRPSLLFNLGRLMLDLRRDGEAESFFSKVVASSPPDVEALGGLGESLARQGRHADALQCHARALAIAPDTSQMQANFARCAAYAHLRPDRLDLDLLEPALRVCLESDAVDHQSLAAVVSAVLQAKHPAMRGLMEDRLVLLGLSKVIVANARDEALFTALRRGLLLSGVPQQAEAFACALACQCFLNEYVWDQDAEESAALAQLEAAPPSIGRFALLACYRKPTRADAEGCVVPAEVMRRLIVEPEIEAALAARLPRGELEDPVSREVGAMYEENPYPRWTGMFAERSLSYVEWILEDLAPHAPALGTAVERPRILVAGCGTGRDPLAYARFFRGAEVRAIDLSRASLGLAQRKADELGVRNVEFVQQDILSMREEGAYDVVSCLGVLHHMADPEAGLGCLVRALKPDGFLMMALYSAWARRDISRIRGQIARAGDLPTPEGIRRCRQRVRGESTVHNGGLAANLLDFYSLSMARDLLFHVQEHQFTLPQIAALLGRQGLQFVGFRLSDPAAKALYRARWPGDGAMTDLYRWERLEAENPLLFRGMYQFWARKMRGP